MNFRESLKVNKDEIPLEKNVFDINEFDDKVAFQVYIAISKIQTKNDEEEYRKLKMQEDIGYFIHNYDRVIKIINERRER